MRKLMFIFIVLIGIAVVGILLQQNAGEGHKGINNKASQVSPKKKKSPQNEVEREIGKMTLEEKIGQMVIAGLDGTEMDQHAQKLIHDDKVGGFIFYSNNLTSPEQTVDFVNQLKKENAPNHWPLFLSVDQEGGDVARLPALQDLPNNHLIGQKNDAELSYDIGKLLGRQVKAFGMNLNFAPVMDVDSNPNNPVIGNRSFSDNKSIVSKLGIQTLKGMESEKTIPVIKHFPGHGDTSVDSHVQLPKLDKDAQQLSDLELVPFKKAIDQGVDAVLVAHILLPKLKTDLPSSMSKEVITGLLRDRLGYDGVVMTDDMTMNAITGNYSLADAAVKAVQAGNDIILVAHGYDNAEAAIQSINQAVQYGEISEKRIDESVQRIIALKQKYDLKDSVSGEADVSGLNESVQAIQQRLQ